MVQTRVVLAVVLLAAPAVALKIERHAEAATDTDGGVETQQASWTCAQAEQRLKQAISELPGATYNKDQLKTKIRSYGVCNLGPGAFADRGDPNDIHKKVDWWSMAWWTKTYPKAFPRDFVDPAKGPRAQADTDGKATSPHAARTAYFRLSSLHEHKKGTKDTVITEMANKDGGLACGAFLGGNCDDDEMQARWWAFRKTCCIGLTTCGKQAIYDGQAVAPGNYACGAKEFATENHNELCTHVDDLSLVEPWVGACETTCCRMTKAEKEARNAKNTDSLGGIVAEFR